MEVVYADKSRTVRAVDVVHKAEVKAVRARREVILSAGTFGSAKILMLSGIGPKEHLTKLGVCECVCVSLCLCCVRGSLSVSECPSVNLCLGMPVC